jgi:hypothetical protein
MWSSFLRRFGYVRLRDYNLRAAKDGTLVPISSNRPVLIDLSHPALLAPANAWLPQPPRDLAEGTVDGLDPAPVKPIAPRWIESRTEQLYSMPTPAPSPFSFEEEDELPYEPWCEEELEDK